MKLKQITWLPLLAMLVFPAWSQDAERAITNITGDVYRFQNRFHYSIFVITGEGVVMTDPISVEAADWLVSEIGRMTDQPITHLIYSHSHGDHAAGGGFVDAPNVIAHANAPSKIDGVAPTERFEDAMTLEVGTKTLELTYLGPGHGQDLIAMVVRPENVAFVVDAVSAKRLFYRDFPGANVDDWIEQVRRVNELDFEILAGGHGPLGEKPDVAAALRYLEELRAEVLSGLQAGKTVDQLKAEITLADYSYWQGYDNWRELNIQGMARHLMESGAVAQ
jgi:glyoxylase-like metal-dependent hydrolase (beta-lactamase superfamily II)